MKKLYFLLILLLTFAGVSYSQAGDCPALCVTGDISSTTAVDGSTDELDSGNAGCLSVNEASSSYWYQVCFTGSGTFSFNLDPDGNSNDFDFAVWTGTACPPTTAPARCSFAASPKGAGNIDITGLGTNIYTGTAATDNSEGAGGDGYVAALSVSKGSCITLNINNYGAGSDVFSLDFTGTAGMTCVGVPLGLDMISFEGKAKEDFNCLTWLTEGEIQTERYTVQKSYDLYEWKSIASIPKTELNNYTYNDYNIQKETAYYRIETVDKTNNHYFTKVIVLSGERRVKVVSKRIYDAYGKQYMESNLPSGMIIYVTEYEDGTIETRKEFK